MKRIFQLLIPGFLAAAFLVSCKGKNAEKTGFGDAVIVARSSGGKTMFGLNLHAFSTDKMTSVTAYAASLPADAYTLTPWENLSTEYLYETSSDLFTTTIPVTGEYRFRVNFAGGDTITYTDKLTTEVVLPPQIIRCSFRPAEKLLDLEWSQVDNASFYNMKLYDSEEKILFISPLFVTSRTTYTFGENSQGWQVTQFPANKAPVTIEVSTYLLEPGANGALYQATGRTVTQVAWEL